MSEQTLLKGMELSKAYFQEYGESLLEFYPEDVLKKKLAAKLVTMAQSGPYNYGRCGAMREQQEAAMDQQHSQRQSCQPT